MTCSADQRTGRGWHGTVDPRQVPIGSSASRAAGLGNLAAEPPFDRGENLTDVPLRQWFTRRDSVPLLQTSTAAGRRGMLGHENGVAAEGGLLSVVHRLRSRQPLNDELFCMLKDYGQTFLLQVKLIGISKSESPPEFGFCESREEVVEIVHVELSTLPRNAGGEWACFYRRIGSLSMPTNGAE